MTSMEAIDLSRPLRIGTRKSQLALWQANWVRDELIKQWGERLVVELVEMSTKGDEILDRPLSEVGGKGLFVNGIEERLASGDVDLAVHSMKDLPGELAPGMRLCATPVRADPRDVLVGPEGAAEVKISKLPSGTRIGTSSLRRAALLTRMNSSLEIVPVRGNVTTRIGKIDEGVCDYVVLALAGLERLGLAERVVETFSVERFCPAAGQGILALECRADDQGVLDLVAPLDDPATAVVAAAERSFLARLNGGCQVPMGCYAELRAEDVLTVNGVVASPSGRPCFVATKVGKPGDAARLGRDLAESLLRIGANVVFDAIDHQPKLAS